MQKNRLITIYAITAAGAVAAIFLTINYDLYNYHLWAYTSVRYGIDQIYNNALYFDRAFDYLPLGGYFEVLAGKLASYVLPLTISDVPLLFVYKIIPLIFVYFILRIITDMFKTISIKRYIVILSLPLLIIASLYGENDVIIIFLLINSIISFESGRKTTGIILALLNLVIKQTSLFLTGGILLYYFLNSDHRMDYILRTVHAGLWIFLISFSPFIIKGNLIETLMHFIHNTLDVISPLSCMAFNLFSLIPGAQYLDFNYKWGLLSIKSYSLIILVSFIFIIVYKLRKHSIWKVIVLVSLIWYNLHVGLHTHHMVYVTVFVTIFTFRNRISPVFLCSYSILLTLNMLLTQSLFTMQLFNIPSLPRYWFPIFALLQLITGVGTAIYVLGPERKLNKQHIKADRGFIWIAVTMLVTVAAIFFPGRYDRNEQNWIDDMIREGRLANYSQNSYIEADIVSRGPFSNYLGIRMSDKSYMNVVNDNLMEQLRFKAYVEYDDSALLTVNDSIFSIYDNNSEILLSSFSDTLSFNAQTFSKYAVISVYDFKYE